MENTHEDIKKDISADRLDYYAEIKKTNIVGNLHPQSYKGGLARFFHVTGN